MRIVIKIGTSLLAPGGRIDTTLLRSVVDQLDVARNEYLVVTSGAIASGMSNRVERKADQCAADAGLRRRGPECAHAHL